MKELKLIAKAGFYLLAGDIVHIVISYFFLFFVLLIPKFGIVGAALAFSAGVIYVNLVRLYQATKIVKALPYSWYLWKPIVANLVASAAVFLIFPMGRLYVFWQLVPLFIVYGLIYLALILLFRINHEDWFLLVAAVQKFKRKVNWQQENG